MATRNTSLNLPLPLQFLAAWIGVWLGRVLQAQVDYLKAENRERHLRLAIAECMRHYSWNGTIRAWRTPSLMAKHGPWPEMVQSFVGNDSADCSNSTIEKPHEWLRRNIGSRRHAQTVPMPSSS
jgi:hypothetical protein